MFPEDPSNTWAMIGARLSWMIPELLVAIAALVVALVLIRRCKLPAVLVLVASVGMLVIGIGTVIAREYMMRGVYLGYRDFEEVRTPILALDIARSVLGGVLLGLVVTAVFVGRKGVSGMTDVNSGAPFGDSDHGGGVPPTAPPGPAMGSGEGPGPGPSQRIPKGFFLASIYGSVLVTFLLLIPAIVMLAQQDDDLLPIALGVICFAYLPIIYSVVMGMVLVYKLWATIQDGDVRTTPGKAVGFLWIPLFNLYWIFQAYWGFAQDFNAYTSQRGIHARRVSEGLALAICIVAIVAAIPYIGILIGLVNIVLTWIFLSQAIDGANAVRAARGQAFAAA